MHKLKIAYILPGRGRNGGIHSTVTACNLLIQKGHSVDLYVCKGERTLRATLRKIYTSMFFRKGNDWVNECSGPVHEFRDIQECKFIKNEIVVASGWWAARELKKISGEFIKVHHVRGIGSPDMNMMKDCWQEKVPKLLVATYLVEFIKKVCDPNVDIAVVPNGINTKEYYFVGHDFDRVGVGSIYGAGYHKDPDTINAVMEKIHKSFPAIPQVMFGMPSKPSGYRGTYYRLPDMSRIRDCYSMSKVWLLLSRSEGLPNPVFEAMACGCAVVATDCGGTRDIIQDGVNGFLCEVGNVDQIVEKALILMKDEKLRKRFVEESQKTVREFSWEKSTDKHEQALLKIYQANKK